MADGMQNGLTDPSNPMYIMKPLAYQLPNEICKMLEKRAQAGVVTNLQYALVCFTLDRLEPFKKIKGSKIDFIPVTTSSEVKTPQPPPRSGAREFYSTDQ